jgi:hypothetical protein
LIKWECCNFLQDLPKDNLSLKLNSCWCRKIINGQGRSYREEFMIY